MSERGEISITGLLVAMSIFIAVLGATLTTFEAFDSQSSALVRRTDAQDAARRAADRVARDLRNLAGPTQNLPEAVDVAEPSELVFNVVDDVKPETTENKANVKRVRYCLNAASRAIWKQEQTWIQADKPTTMPDRTSCPSTAWGGAEQVSPSITNGGRPIFSYDTTTLTSVSFIGVDLFVDDQPDAGPPETRIATGVFLRNQNRVPTARFTATPNAQGVLLNGSASSDPEGQPLRYEWYDGTEFIGAGVTFQYAALGGATNLSLRVFDPAGLGGTATIPQENT